MKITVIVCTYNREKLIGECLQSLVEQNISKTDYEVLIIDNNSTDSTESICQSFVEVHKNFRYIKELQQGLSHARNCGYKNATTEWLAYVDDDAKAKPNYVERALYIIESYDFDGFGGVYNAWYTVKKPKWIWEDFGTNKNKQLFTGILNQGSMDGGNMVWKRSVINKLGGFPTDIGMNGGSLGYGEETYLNTLANKNNYKIGFDPELQIDHYVQPYKLNLSWHIKEIYTIGRDYWKAFDKVPIKNDINFWNYQYLFRQMLLKALKMIPKLAFKKDYYYQNYIIDISRELVIYHGKSKSARKILSKNLKH